MREGGRVGGRERERDRQTDRQTGDREREDAWMYACMGGWVDGWKDGWMELWKRYHRFSCYPISLVPSRLLSFAHRRLAKRYGSRALRQGILTRIFTSVGSALHSGTCSFFAGLDSFNYRQNFKILLKQLNIHCVRLSNEGNSKYVALHIFTTQRSFPIVKALFLQQVENT